MRFTARPWPPRLSTAPWRARSRRAGRGRSRVRRAAVAVVLGAVLYAGTQLGVGVAIRAEWSPLRDPVYFDKFALLAGHPAFHPAAPAGDKPLTILLVGTSRLQNAADAGAASARLTAGCGRPVEVFNFAQAGAGPVTNAVYVRRLVKAGVAPDFVLIEIHPVFLAGQRLLPPETRWLLPFRLTPDELPVVRDLGFPASPPATHGPQGLIAPLYEYRFLILDRYFPVLLMSDSRISGGQHNDRHGFARLEEAVAPGRRTGLLGRTYGQYADYLSGYRPTGPGVAAIRDTLAQCRAAGWRAGLVLMPESTELLGWYAPEGLKELDAVLAGLSAEYGVPVFDARTWVPDALSADGHHLTGPGADLFTDRLCRDALGPWVGRAAGPTPGGFP